MITDAGVVVENSNFHVSSVNTALVVDTKSVANSYMMDDDGEDDA